MAGLITTCIHDIRVGTNIKWDDAIVLFRNILLDPVYPEIVLYLLSSAKYNSVSYKIESYLWIQHSHGWLFGVLAHLLSIVVSKLLLAYNLAIMHCSVRLELAELKCVLGDSLMY